VKRAFKKTPKKVAQPEETKGEEVQSEADSEFIVKPEISDKEIEEFQAAIIAKAKN
jgi:hypothetical protein